MKKHEVTVTIPATSANLGSGFDCLGMSLDIWNDVSIAVSSSPEVYISGEGSDTLKLTDQNLVYKAAQFALSEMGEKPWPLSIRCINRIPLDRGLGSSAAAIIGGLLAANSLFEKPLDTQLLLRLAIKLEGHADNVTPALLGGCQLVVHDEHTPVTCEITIPPNLMAVLFIPDKPMPTNEGRAILPALVDRRDAIYNIGRAAMLAQSLTTGNLNNLHIATQDKLHQPHREKIFPAMPQIFTAALNAGASAVFLSGGGSSILALATSRLMTIGYEMANAADKAGVTGNLKITSPSSKGAQVISG